MLSEIPAHFSASRPTIRSFPVNNALVSPRPPQNPGIFCKKPAREHDILSRSPLFSYTSPEVPSLLTSLRVSSPFLTLISTLSEPPHLVQAGISHFLHKHRALDSRGNEGGLILGWFIDPDTP